MTGKKFKVMTLGCRTNQYESQAYIDQLLALGYEKAGELEDADVCIVNTCTVTETAHSSSKQTVRQLIKQNPNTKMIVTGCAAEKNPEVFSNISGVLKVISNKEKEQLLPISFPDQEWPEFAIKQFEAHTRAFVKVQDGCNSYCTYCIIPYVRGRSRSRRVNSIVEEVKSLIASGFQEIVLTGINIGDFDGAPEEREAPVRLAELVRIIDGIEGVKRLRLSSIDPDEVDDDLMDAVINGRSTCHSLHIVLQSGSNVVLKRMNRKYTAQMFSQAIEKMKGASKNFTFTTDVIVGFPGETEEDFLDTLKLMEEARFAKVHMFPYSKRERTRAALYPNQVPQEVLQTRKRKVLEVAEKTAFSLREEYVGSIANVLLESEENGVFFGHTENFLPVFIQEKNLSSNQIVSVKLIENHADGLKGKIL